MILKLCPKAVLRTVLFTSKVVSNVALPHFCASMAFTAREGANFSFVEGHAQASPKTPPRVALLASFVQELHLRGRPGQVAKLDLCTLRGILKAYPRVHRLRLSDLIWWGTECQRAGVLVRMGGSLWIETVDGLELAQEEDRVEVVEEPIDVEAEDGRGEGPTTWVTNGEDYVLSEGPTPSLEHLGLHEHNEPLPPRLTSMTLTRVISATAAHDRLGLLDLLGPEPIVALKYDVLKLYAATRARGSSSQESSYSAVAACSANQIVEVAEEIKRLPSATGATSLELIELSDLTARHLVPVLVAAGPTVKHLHLAMSRRSHGEHLVRLSLIAGAEWLTGLCSECRGDVETEA